MMSRRGLAKSILGAGVAALVLGLGARPAAAQVAPPYPPYYRPVPPPRREIIPVAPGTAYVWLPGHWIWNGAAYVWRPGHYVLRRHGWHHWVNGHWRVRAGMWVWVPAHWAR